MSAEWAAVWTNVLGAVANFLVAAVAIWAVFRQRAHQIADREGEEYSLLSAALFATEAAAYEVQTTYWQLDSSAKSAAIVKFQGPLDFTLRITALHRKASILDLINDGRLPVPLMDHVAGVTRLIRSAIEVLEGAQGTFDPTCGQVVLGPLLDLRHQADLERETNEQLSQWLGAYRPAGLPPKSPSPRRKWQGVDLIAGLSG